jgi:hypothetical protein
LRAVRGTVIAARGAIVELKSTSGGFHVRRLIEVKPLVYGFHLGDAHVRTRTQLLSFRDERRYLEPPTEVIDLKDVAAVLLPAAAPGSGNCARMRRKSGRSCCL